MALKTLSYEIDVALNLYGYLYDPFYAGAYSTKTQDTLGHVVSGTYDFTTGLLTSFTNAKCHDPGERQ